ncbi:30S ribosomal protein S3, putative isoform 1 [Theobroma cacao]|uniref:30S ribosomal protein S3, putative isoform 1 n=1 Tax=Theobroma cacao TaxID=3641 RepID=A0A061GSZ4_THECC|nr:30S ribosomal protein S3, putative isoform 1 [Theobroma cacao]
MVGPPKKHFLAFLLLLSLCIILLLLCSPHPNTISTQTFPLNAHSILNTPTFSLTIKVLTFNRLNSLTRCLTSLSNAYYLPDHPVHLHIFIDHFPNQSKSGIDPKLQDSLGILQFVDGFEWKWGQKIVHYRTTNVGLQAQWLEAWWPTSDNEFAFVVEDDLELSPLFFKYLRALILNYYYNASNFSPFVYGASLQRPRFVPGKHGNKMLLDSTSGLFLYQLVGTWGQLLFPKPWKEFRLWYDDHKGKGIKPFLEGMVTTGWYKKMGEKIWTPWFIKFIHSRGYFNIYTKFPDEKSLSVSHRDVGVNYGKTAGPDSQLLDVNSLDSNSREMKSLSTMKWYDFCFREVVPGRVVRNLNDLGSILPSVQTSGTVLLVSLFAASEAVTRNLLCHFERLNIWNYIFIGPATDFLFDLARRGHPVIDADQFLNNIRAYKSMGIQDLKARFKNDILLKAYVVKKCLEFSYNTWVVDGNMVLVNNDLFLKSIDSTYNFYAGESLDLFFVKNSPSAHKILADDFLYDVAALLDKNSLPTDSRKFVSVMAKLLEKKGFRVKRIDEKSFGEKLGNQNLNRTLETDKRVVYWSRESDIDSIQMRLQELSLWVIDNDSSCTAVVCHKS